MRTCGSNNTCGLVNSRHLGLLYLALYPDLEEFHHNLATGSESIFYIKLPLAANTTSKRVVTIREIKHRVFFSRERQRGSRDLAFPAFAVCRPPFLLEEDIFPVWRERENVSICSPSLLSISPF